jgi:hypothetical protein
MDMPQSGAEEKDCGHDDRCQPVPLTAVALSEYPGTYAPAWEKSWAITVYSEGDRLFYDSVMPGDKKVELFFMGNDTFFVTPDSNDAFIFTHDAAGRVCELKMFTMDGSYDESEKVSLKGSL